MDIDTNKGTIAEDQPSYNLIDRLPDIYDIIFSYLDVKSLLNACLVCKSWNELIGQSSELMQKIQVNLEETSSETDTETALNTIKGWKRKICHLEAVTCGYGSHETLISYLNQNPSILEHLVKFNIEVLDLNLSQIKNILIASKLLRNLTITAFDDLSDMMTKADWTELVACFKKLQLETLFMSFTRESNGSADLSTTRKQLKVSNEIAKLFKTQMQLEKLHIRALPLSAKMVKAISKMEKLKVLTLQSDIFEDLQLYDNILVGNMPSLESFNIEYSSFEFFHPIINAAHNLISLKINYLDQDFINIAGLKLNKLKKLHAFSLGHIFDIANPDLFPALEELHIHRSIQTAQLEILVLVIFDEPPTNFLRCLYQEITKP